MAAYVLFVKKPAEESDVATKMSATHTQSQYGRVNVDEPTYGDSSFSQLK